MKYNFLFTWKEKGTQILVNRLDNHSGYYCFCHCCVFCFILFWFFELGSCYVAKAGLKLMCPSNSPISASQVSRTAGDSQWLLISLCIWCSWSSRRLCNLFTACSKYQREGLYTCFFSFFFFFCCTRVWTQGLHLEPHPQPCFVKGFLRARVSWSISPG
jgi:hypothetical protein